MAVISHSGVLIDYQSSEATALTQNMLHEKYTYPEFTNNMPG